MNCFPCCQNPTEKSVSKKSIRKSIKNFHHQDRKVLSSFANISFKTGNGFIFWIMIHILELNSIWYYDALEKIKFVDSSRHRYISEEISKFRKGSIQAKIFSYRELSAATSSFHPENFIGEGGFGRVYRGKLESLDQVLFFSLL